MCRIRVSFELKFDVLFENPSCIVFLVFLAAKHNTQNYHKNWPSSQQKLDWQFGTIEYYKRLGQSDGSGGYMTRIRRLYERDQEIIGQGSGGYITGIRRLYDKDPEVI